MDTAVTRLRCERTGVLPDYAPGAPPIWMYGVAYVSPESDAAPDGHADANPASRPPPPAYVPVAPAPAPSNPTFNDVCF